MIAAFGLAARALIERDARYGNLALGRDIVATIEAAIASANANGGWAATPAASWSPSAAA
jgi:hypothetical protein